jgi:hypothetical protein
MDFRTTLNYHPESKVGGNKPIAEEGHAVRTPRTGDRALRRA